MLVLRHEHTPKTTTTQQLNVFILSNEWCNGYISISITISVLSYLVKIGLMFITVLVLK